MEEYVRAPIRGIYRFPFICYQLSFSHCPCLHKVRLVTLHMTYVTLEMTAYTIIPGYKVIPNASVYCRGGRILKYSHLLREHKEIFVSPSGNGKYASTMPFMWVCPTHAVKGDVSYGRVC